MYFRVRLTNSALDKSIAEIVPHKSGTIVVVSENSRMKVHLQKILSAPANILAPGLSGPGFYADGVYTVWPGSQEYVRAIPEILSWHGYLVDKFLEVHKSVEFLDFSALKSMDDYIYYNAKQERIVKRVPEGYIAVNNASGKMVPGGGYLRANIDKEDAEWVLIDNPYEGYTPEQRGQSLERSRKTPLVEYHPGMEEELYKLREEDDFYVSDFEVPEEWKKPLSEVFTELSGPDSPREVGSKGLHVPEGSLDRKFPPGGIIYNPSEGLALLSENWPPTEVEGYEHLKWYMYEGAAKRPEAIRAAAVQMGASLTPALITGLEGTTGVVKTEPKMKVHSASFQLSRRSSVGILLSDPEVSAIDARKVEVDSDYLASVTKVRESLGTYRGLLFNRTSAGHIRLGEDIEDFVVPEFSKEFSGKYTGRFRGMFRGISQGKFDPDAASMVNGIKMRPEQEVMAAAMADMTQYEIGGGPRGAHGFFLGAGTGTGKTVTVLRADAIMRRRGDLVNGEQMTVITAPTIQPHTWKAEIKKFRGEEAEIIGYSPGGHKLSRSERIEQWERLLERASRSELPKLLIVPNSAITQDRDEELTMDTQYMQLLAQGGTQEISGRKVKGGHIGVLAVDEVGQFMTQTSNRSQAIKSLAESVYQGKGLVWGISAQVLANGAPDVIGTVALFNKVVRDNQLLITNKYSQSDRSRQSFEGAFTGRKWFESDKAMREFMLLYGSSMISLDSETIAGDRYARTRDTEIQGISKPWYGVYLRMQGRMLSYTNKGERDEHLRNRGLGLMAMMDQVAKGAVEFQRLIEYGEDREFLEMAKEGMSVSDVKDFNEQVQEYRRRVHLPDKEFGKPVPDTEMDTTERDKIYEEVVSEKFRRRVDDLVFNLGSPVRGAVMNEVRRVTSTKVRDNEYGSVGIASQSTVFLDQISRELSYYGDKLKVIKAYGPGVDSARVAELQKEHRDATGRPVVVLVSSSGTYGLSFPTTNSIRLPTWSTMAGEQMEGRFARNPLQKHHTKVITVSGVSTYAGIIERRKRIEERRARLMMMNPKLSFSDERPLLTFGEGIRRETKGYTPVLDEEYERKG